jgi:hypothetical protein
MFQSEGFINMPQSTKPVDVGKYQDKLNELMSDALDAEDMFDLDELERFAEEYRRKQMKEL